MIPPFSRSACWWITFACTRGSKAHVMTTWYFGDKWSEPRGDANRRAFVYPVLSDSSLGYPPESWSCALWRGLWGSDEVVASSRAGVVIQRSGGPRAIGPRHDYWNGERWERRLHC